MRRIALFIGLVALAGCPGSSGNADSGSASGEDGGQTHDAGGSGPGPDAGHSDAGTDSGVSGVADAGPDHALGVDMPDLLRSYLGVAGTDAAAARQQMDDAVASGFNHARFIASGFWPVEMTTGSGWVANPAGYWAAFDTMVADAQTRGLRLVPSIFWNTFLFPDVAGEPLGQLFVPGSHTRTLAEQYLTEMVSRYAGSDTILFWEVGNEMNLLADLDFSTCNVCDGGTANACGGLAPPLGTPCERTTADNFFSCNGCRGVTTSTQDLGQFAGAMGALIHSLDPAHEVSSGYGYLRPSAHHLAASPCPACDWTLDTPDEYAQSLAQLHPNGIDIISVHHYPGSDAQRFGSDDQMGIDLLTRTQALATGMGKPLFVGEYGENVAGTIPACGGGTQVCGGDPAEVFTHRVLDDVVTQRVPYTSVWAFEWFQFCSTASTCLETTAGDDFTAAMAVHQSAYGSCAGRADGTACPIGVCASAVCTPVSEANESFDAPGAETGWLNWTNCSACTPGTFQRVATTDGGYGALTSNDLPCDADAGCGFPGAYALSPSFPLAPGHALVTVGTRSTTTHAQVHFWVYDSGGNTLAGWQVPVPQGSGFTAAGTWVALPAGAASGNLRLELPDPNAELDFHWATVAWEP